MKGSIFRFFFTLSLILILFLSFAAGQKNKTAINKSTSVNKSDPVNKPTTINKPIVNTVKYSPKTSTIPVTEQAVLEEINALRDNPQKYIVYLQEYRQLFKGNMLNVPNEPAMETIEGVAAVDDCINFLKTAAKLYPYTFSKGLNLTANLQLKDLMLDSSIGHIGKNGSTLSQRLAKFGEVGNIFAENISFAAKTPREIVLNMLIDDGLKSRNHRKNLFSSTFKIIGLGFGIGKDGEGLCVADFADSFREK